MPNLPLGTVTFATSTFSVMPAVVALVIEGTAVASAGATVSETVVSPTIGSADAAEVPSTRPPNANAAASTAATEPFTLRDATMRISLPQATNCDPIRPSQLTGKRYSSDLGEAILTSIPPISLTNII